MKKVNIIIDKIADVKEFLTEVVKCDYEVDLICGKYIIDAKSIMGIFSLDLSKPLEVCAHSDDCDNFFKAIDKFIVK